MSVRTYSKLKTVHIIECSKFYRQNNRMSETKQQGRGGGRGGGGRGGSGGRGGRGGRGGGKKESILELAKVSR